ncbi:MAG: dienelactone hydrolase family protein [Opitutaceae bacterium]|jgi:predicted esterase
MHLHDTTHTLRFGAPLAKARGVVILVHGRGSSAEDISGLADIFDAVDLAYLAPEATNNTWYPNRFLVPPANNEPWLSSALAVIDTLVAEALAAGIPSERIALAGFSQGACLVLEYAARHPRRYAFVAALSGALIGPTDIARDCVDLLQTPVLIGCAERDAHIPLEHVEHSAAALGAFNASVTKQIFPGSAHTVFPAEVDWLKTHSVRLPARA